MRIALVINRSAGTFRRLVPEAVAEDAGRALRDAGHQVAVTLVGSRDLAAALSRAATDETLDAVVVGGGDGSVLTAVLAGLGASKPLGVLPVGTLNLFARDLHLPLEPTAAAAALGRGTVRDIDLAEVNGHPFTIWASMGLHPWMVRRRDHLQRDGMRKWPAMAWAALRAFRRYPLVKVSLAMGDDTVELATPLLVISNNPWAERRPPLSRASLDRGVLVVHAARCTTRLGLLWLAFNSLLGRWNRAKLLDTYQADSVRVVTKKRRALLSLDGEVTVLRAPLVFRCRPRSLKVLMP